LRLIIATTGLVLIHLFVQAQTAYHFRNLTVQDGLNDGHVQAIGQDKYGNIWLGTLGGLNKFDAYRVTRYYHAVNKPNSILSGLAMCMALTEAGRFFIGFENGLMEYNYAGNDFSAISEFEGEMVLNIRWMKNELFVQSNNQLYRLDLSSKKREKINLTLPDGKELTVNSISSFENKIIVSTNESVYAYHPATNHAIKLVNDPRLAGNILNACYDYSGNLWVNTSGKSPLFYVSADLKRIRNVDFVFDPPVTSVNYPLVFLTSSTGKTWILSKGNGLIEHDSESNTFHNYAPNKYASQGVSSGYMMSGFFDRDGNIWMGTRNGATYFNSTINEFRNIAPPFKLEENIEKLMGRVAIQDDEGQYWLGFNAGLARYDPHNQRYKLWQNTKEKDVLYQNPIRELHLKDNKIRALTTRGVNLIDIQTGKTEFITGLSGSRIYTSFMVDREGVEWYGCNETAGVFFRKPGNDDGLISAKEHPHLKALEGVQMRKFFKDSNDRLWFGSVLKGLFLYDYRTNKIIHFSEKGQNSFPISGNSIIDIKEDKKGVIWVTTDQGLSGIHPQTYATQNFTVENGLPTPSVFSLVIDPLNRIWIGASNALIMLDENRARFFKFNKENGLPCAEFTEFTGYISQNNEILLGTQCGFLQFKPLEFISFSRPISCIISDLKINNIPYLSSDINNTSHISLEPNQNTLEFEFAGIHFTNPQNVEYAYMLKGAEKEWNYTFNRISKYLDLKAGNYQLLYKARDINGEWPEKENVLNIKIAAFYYQTLWFKTTVILTLALFIFGLYHFRNRQRFKILELKGIAQELEREKAVVLYESLKQQLNPHFLFNSLASLSSMVAADPGMAKKFIDRLSRVYRYLLNSSENVTVSLEQELEFIQHYTQLQKTRFEEGLSVNILIDEAFLQHKIVPVTIQNMIENAIKHNTLDDENPLIIEISVKEDYLIISNNLQKRTMVETSNKKGLNQLVSLYKYLTEKPVVIEENAAFFTIKIPLIQP
jgi:ligand-binding sensor domain-containing protein